MNFLDSEEIESISHNIWELCLEKGIEPKQIENIRDASDRIYIKINFTNFEMKCYLHSFLEKQCDVTNDLDCSIYYTKKYRKLGEGKLLEMIEEMILYLK